MRNRSRHGKKSGGKLISLLILLGLLGGAGYIYTAPEFEREKPAITHDNNIFWNRADPIKIILADNEGLKSYELLLSDGTQSIIVGQGTFDALTKEKTLLVNYPKSRVLDPKAKRLTLKVSVTDKSMWNLLKGNSSEQTIDINVDYKKPNVNILANSYSITQGGAALVVFQASDENLESLYIQAGENRFKAQPYKKEGYYAALIAWPFDKKEFKAKVVAVDKAKNQRIADIPYYLKNFNYKVSWIKASDKFIDGKISDLASSDPEYAHIDDRLEKFVAVNETMRLRNEELIHKISKVISSEPLEKWKMTKFYPLRNGQKVASYGDERHYYYKNKDNKISHSYHVGYDLASTKMATIKASNPGKVVYADSNGIYGNMPMIDHGLGLYSLYGHCSELLVSEGDEVSAGQAIAKTGVSGLALGDHLHFGILVQGIEVRPVEWFDQSWIRKNIDNIFQEADKIIEDR